MQTTTLSTLSPIVPFKATTRPVALTGKEEKSQEQFSNSTAASWTPTPRPTFAASAPIPVAQSSPVTPVGPPIPRDEMLVVPGIKVAALQPGLTHKKAATERPSDYPDRHLQAGDPVQWDDVSPGYLPTPYTSPVVCKQPNWADPPSPIKSLSSRPGGKFQSYEGDVNANKDGTPLNPRGRTGITGRGLLGKWGANFAADPVVTRINPESGKLEMIAISRTDSGDWAIPGGMVDQGEKVSSTLARELSEEALGKQAVDSDKMTAMEGWFKSKFEDAHKVYAGYSDDRRNTDNAWMETQVYHVHLTPDEALKVNLQAGDDAAKVQWMPVTQDNLEKLYSNHGSFVTQAIGDWNRTPALPSPATAASAPPPLKPVVLRTA